MLACRKRFKIDIAHSNDQTSSLSIERPHLDLGVQCILILFYYLHYFDIVGT